MDDTKVPINDIHIEGYGNIDNDKLRKALKEGANNSNGGLNLNILREIGKLCKIKGYYKLTRSKLEKELCYIYFPVEIKYRPVKPVKPLVPPTDLCRKSVPNNENVILYESLMSHIQYRSLERLNTKTTNPCANTKILARHHAQLIRDMAFICTYGSSVFVRSSEQDMSTIQFMISGPQNTPYQNGLFYFTLSMESKFPSEPPIVDILNTAGGKIRHNPNLYACGKVCLSILNTWTGGARWTINTTLKDVILGIQSYVLSENPWENEPGHSCDQKAIKAYNHVLRLSTLIDGMYQMMKNPPEGFLDVVLFHFYGPKRMEILEQISGWERELDTLRHKDISGYMKSQTYYHDENQFKCLFKETIDKIKQLYDIVLN